MLVRYSNVRLLDYSGDHTRTKQTYGRWASFFIIWCVLVMHTLRVATEIKLKNLHLATAFEVICQPNAVSWESVFCKVACTAVCS